MAILRIAILAVLAQVAATAGSYNTTLSATTSSMTIAGSTHQLGGSRLAVRVRDAAGNTLNIGQYSYSIDASSYDVSLNFSPSLTSGAQVFLFGPYPSTDTSASTDFQPSAGAYTFTVCASCSVNAPARRTVSGAQYIAEQPVTFTWTTTPADGEYLLVYVLNGILTFAGNNYTPQATCSSSACAIAGSVSAYPFGSLPISTAYWHGGGWYSWTDDRPFAH